MLKWIIMFYKWLFDIPTQPKAQVIPQPEPVISVWYEQPVVATAPMEETPALKKHEYRMTYREWVENNKMLDQLRAS